MTALSPRVATLLTYANLALACIALKLGLATLHQALMLSALAQTLISYFHRRNATDIQLVVGLLLVSTMHFFVFPFIGDNDVPATVLQLSHILSTWGCYAIGSLALGRGAFIVLLVDEDEEPPIVRTPSN